MSGVHPYARPGYVAALGGGTPVFVPEWGGSVLARPILRGGFDAVGPYPMTVLAADADVAGGLARLRAAGFVSATVTPDPLGPTTAAASAAFDVVRPFKTHHLVHPRRYAPSKHHRAEIRRSLARCVVERVTLADVLPTWTALYAGLVRRHAIDGVSAFGDAYFDHLAGLPELVALAARVEDEIVAMGLWFAHAGVAYNHLGASSPRGYAVGASYALYDAAVTCFADCAVINLGGGAGLDDDPADGLARFKRGFADDSVQACIFGKVLDAEGYARRSQGLQTRYFPAYRDPLAGLQRPRTAEATLAMSAAS